MLSAITDANSETLFISFVPQMFDSLESLSLRQA